MIIRRFILSVLTFFIVSLAVSAQVITKEMLTPKEKKLFDKAKNFGMKGDYKNSNKNFETLLKLRPDFVEGILRLASNYNSLKQLNKAESLFLQAVSIAPQYDPEMYYSLALVESELKNIYLLQTIWISTFQWKNPSLRRSEKRWLCVTI
ncbi:MAG: hypothetical protein IPP49_03095 [Saprospiraceae bacterium]|nr:hypothetical protein [Saprospiraceae bacterium]